MLPAASPKRSLIRLKDPFERFQESTRDAWSADDDELTAKATVVFATSAAAAVVAGAAVPPNGAELLPLQRHRTSVGAPVPAAGSPPVHGDGVAAAPPVPVRDRDSGFTNKQVADAAVATALKEDGRAAAEQSSSPTTLSGGGTPPTVSTTATNNPAGARRPSGPPAAPVSLPASPTGLLAAPPAAGASPRIAGEQELATASSKQRAENARVAKLTSLLNGSSSSNAVDLSELRQTSWSGVPARMRPLVWKLLSGYLPAVAERRATTLERKRREYFGFVEQYYDTRHDAEHQDTFRQINIDIPRMSPSLPFLQDPAVQEIFERILYIWAIRHPASGYVQGMNDLVTPFFVAFMCEYTDTCIDGDTSLLPSLCVLLSTEQQRALEADCFWCVSKLLGGVQDNYVFAQPGIQKKVLVLKELVSRADGGMLSKHFEQVGVEFLQFSFRWMNNLLLRELPLRCGLQLWDTYHAEADGFASFHLYVCAAFLLTFAGQLLKQADFQSLMTLLQNLPTEQWGESEMRELVARAYQLKCSLATEALSSPPQQQQAKAPPVASL